MRVALAGLLLIVGCGLVDNAVRRPAELMDEATAAQKVDVEERTLRAHFNNDFAQQKIGHLALSKLGDFDAVVQPRPKLSDIVAGFAEPHSVEERALSPYGVRQSANVHSYGRLGLATPTNRADAEIFWVIIAKSSE